MNARSAARPRMHVSPFPALGVGLVVGTVTWVVIYAIGRLIWGWLS